jgi:hypothetical protein
MRTPTRKALLHRESSRGLIVTRYCKGACGKRGKTAALPSTSVFFAKTLSRNVAGRFSGFQFHSSFLLIKKRRKPSITPSQNRNIRFQWHIVTVVAGYSGASAAEFHGLPKYNPKVGRYLSTMEIVSRFDKKSSTK